MALLPLAGWAQEALPGDVVVTITNNNTSYTGNAITPTFSVALADETDITTKVALDAYYSDNECTKGVAAAEVKDAGTYYVRVKGDGSTYTNDSYAVGTFTIKQAANACGTQPVFADVNYGTAIGNPSTAAAFTFGDATIVYKWAESAEAEAESWSEVKPTSVGTHYVKAFVAETLNWAAATSNAVEVEISKKPISIEIVTDHKTYDGNGAADADIYKIKTGELEAGDESLALATFSGAAVGAVNVGSYSFTIAAKTLDNYAVTIDGATTGTLVIDGAALTVTATPVTITYGETPVYTYTWDGLAAEDRDAEGQPKDGVVTISAPEVKKGSTMFAGAAGTYDITPNVTAENYTITPGVGTLTVNKKNLGEEDITIATPAGSTYTGAVQTRTATVTDTRDIVNAAVAESQYDITYLYSATSATAGDFAAATLKNAGWYKQVVTAKADVNYTGSKTSEAFYVDKAELMIQADDKETVYTGVALAQSAFTYTYEGFLGSDEASVGELNSAFTTLPTIASIPTNAGNHAITPAGAVAQNYKFIYVDGTLAIAKNKIKVTPINVNKAYGSTGSWSAAAGSIRDNKVAGWIKLNTQDADGTYGADITNQAGITALLAQTYNTSSKVNYITGLAIASDVTATSAADTYDITASGAVAANSNNYDIVYAKGVYTVTPQEFTFTVANKAKTYGDADPQFTYTINQSISSADKTAIQNAVTLERVAGEKAGNYTISMKVAEGFAPTNYSIDASATGTLVIKKANLTISANTQVLYTGDKEADLSQTAWTAETLKTINGVADVAKVSLAFGTNDVADEESEVTVNGEGELTLGGTEDADYDYGIVVTLENEEALAANYNITLVNGKLTVKNLNGSTLLAETEDLTNLEAGKKNVTFSSRNLKAGVWYTMALPFDVKVRDLSDALGYAIVDKFVASESSDDMNFKIFMGTIDAYTPFLVKVDEDINLNTVTIKNVTVEALDDNKANMTQENASYYFKSNFKYGAVGENFWTDGSNMTAEQFKFNKYAATAKLKALRGFITAKPGVTSAPNIIIEEPDGSTTAIQAINADGVAIEKTGWYTVNGIKLESAPTEKGVYIRNGKKMVIK